MFRLAILSLLASAATSFGTISAKTRAGQRLLKNAKHLSGRKLDNDNGNEAAISRLHLRYTGCYNVYTMAEEGGEEGSGVENRGVITFELTESCDNKGNKGVVGLYATQMLEFLDSYTESMLEEQEWRCEYFRETQCYYCQNNDDEENCENQCFAEGVDPDTGNSMAVCVEVEGEEAFEIQRYLECAEIENQNGNNNGNWNGNGDGYNVYPNWDGEYRVGPYCAEDGESIYLGVFYDEMCTFRGPTDQYANQNYGQELPYSSDPIIPLGACVTCVDQQEQWENNNNGNNNNNYNNNQNANNNNWNNMEPREFCVQSYEQSAKCEVSDNGYFYYTTATGCEFIKSYLPNLAASSAFAFSSGNGGAAIFFAWMFAITTLLFGAYAYFLYRKIKRGGNNTNGGLSSKDGALA